MIIVLKIFEKIVKFSCESDQELIKLMQSNVLRDAVKYFKAPTTFWNKFLEEDFQIKTVRKVWQAQQQ